MKVEYQKKFLTQLAKLPADVRTQIEQFVFEELPECSNIGEAGNIEKLSGYLGFYKIRFGNYRIGAKLEKRSICLKIVMHRKDIYRFFP